jgi:hypothetical protein
MRNGKRLALAGLLAAAMVWAVPMAASASHGSGISQGKGVAARGACSMGASWKLSLRLEDGGRLKAELEVEEVAPGSQWAIVMSDNGTQFFQGTKTANDNGHVRARAKTANQAGADTVMATATNQSNGEVCNAQATR